MNTNTATGSLSRANRRAYKRLVGDGYTFKNTVEGVAWWAPDLSCGCSPTLNLSVIAAKRYAGRVEAKIRSTNG